MPGTRLALSVLLACAFALLAVHARRALGALRAAVELAALAACLLLSEALAHLLTLRPAVLPFAALGALAAAGLVCAAIALASRLWWLSPWGRSVCAALLACAVEMGVGPAAVQAGIWDAHGGGFLGAPLAHAMGTLALVFAWTMAAEIARDKTPRSLLVRGGVALAGVAAAVLLRWTLPRLGVEARMDGPGGWVLWTALWMLPALLALTGRAALLPDSLAGLLGSTPGPLAALALVLVLGAALAAGAALGEPLLAVAAAGPLIAVLAALPAAPPLERWRGRTFARLAHVQDFVRVLMKPRNGMPWTEADRVFLRAGVRTLALWTPGFVLFLLPGGMVLLGVYAWLLDRRRGRAAAARTAHQRRTSDPAGPDAISGRAS